MANKQYISITRLFKHCDISIEGDFNLTRTRKQLQAEFGIARGGFIEVDGYSYTRHDVFEEIERPDFIKRLSFHNRIWNAPQIRQWLEENTVNLHTVREEFRPFWSDKEFDEFFSPYFAGPFNYASRNLLAETKLQEIGELLRYEDFLLPAEREEAFRSIRIYLDENQRLLRNVNQQNYEMMRPKIAHWIDADWSQFFNNLPSEFYDVKYEIVVSLVNIGVAVQKKHRKDCRHVSEHLVLLTDMPEHLRKTILSNHEAYTSASVTSSSSWRGGFWIFWIIFILARATGSDGCDRSSSNYPVDFKYFDSYKSPLLDSLQKKNYDSAFSYKLDPKLRKKLDSLKSLPKTVKPRQTNKSSKTNSNTATKDSSGSSKPDTSLPKNQQ